MTTISDAERRGIVESLRREADDWRSGFDDTAVPVYELFDKLADLIDPDGEDDD